MHKFTNEFNYNAELIGHNLKKLRLQKGMTVREVAAYMCLHQGASIYRWERGQILPSTDCLLALLELYEVYDIRKLLAPLYEEDPQKTTKGN